MNKVKKYAISLSVMIVVAVLSLLLLSVLTYIFKWQADKAMIGIVATYVLAGFVGGMVHKNNVFLLSTLFMFVLLFLSIMVRKSDFEMGIHFFTIWAIVTSGAFLGAYVKNKCFVVKK